MLTALRGKGPYPILAFAGEMGTAKSDACIALRRLTDPNQAELRSVPKDEADLFIGAASSHVVALDNLSYIPPWLSDAICRLSTGGSISKRALWTDDDEHLVGAIKPVLLNGIEDVLTRSDATDRAIVIQLQPITEYSRKPEKVLWAVFEVAAPRILGALLSAISVGLRNEPDLKLDWYPRMADFALWATACEPALWPTGTFERAYTDNRDEVIDSVIDADPVASAVITLMADHSDDYASTATELLKRLGEIAGDKATKSKSWPATPNSLSRKLRRSAPLLRRKGIEIEYGQNEGKAKNRSVTIKRQPAP
jgi:hypothetical protein